MKHHIRMVHIHMHFRKRFKDHTAHFTVDLLGVHRIILTCTACLHLEGEILIRIVFIQISDHRLPQLFKALILNMDDRTDAADTKNSL